MNTVVIQMDGGTQQNVALVEEATSATQSLKQQADALLDQVSFFKITEDETGRRTQTTGQGMRGGQSRAVAKPVHI